MASGCGVPFTLHQSAHEDAPRFLYKWPIRLSLVQLQHADFRPGQTGHLVNKELGLAYVPM